MAVVVDVQEALTKVSGLDPLQLNDLLVDAPEPAKPGDLSGVRSVGANLLYLFEKLPGAIWNDPGSRLMEARAHRYIGRLKRPSPTDEDRSWPFKVPPKDYQLNVFAAARRMSPFVALAPVAPGCVDADTEYLTKTGWRRIADYAGGEVAQYWPDTGLIDFVEKPTFVKLPCPEMIRFKTSRGVDQMFSPEHRVLLADGEVVTAEFIEQWHSILAPKKLRARTTYRVSTPGVDLSDASIRVQVAVNADGYIHRSSAHPNYNNVCQIRVKKERKKNRLRTILVLAGIEFSERPCQPDGFTIFSFAAPRPKGYDDWWWAASQEQLQVIADESTYWDGSFRRAEGRTFFSSDKAAADFIQHALTVSGRRTSCRQAVRTLEGRAPSEYIVHASSRPPEVSLLGRARRVRRVPTVDGYKYCFQVPSTFLVFRRGGNIFASGNTGKTKMTIDICASKFLEGEIDGVAVIAAPGAVPAQWVDEALPTHMTSKVKWAGTTWKSTRKVAPYLLSPKTKAMRWMTFKVEAFSGSSGKAERALKEFLNSGRMALVWDESSRGKNPRAARTKSILDIAPLAVFRMILSGTPITKGMEDLWSQYEFGDPKVIGMSNYYAFRGRYCVTIPAYRGAGVGAVKITGYRNTEEFVRKIAAVTFVVPKEVLGLDPKTYEELPVELTRDQKMAYNALRHKLVDDLADMKIASPVNAAVRLCRLQQVLCGRVYEQPSDLEEPPFPKLIPSHRVSTLLEYIDLNNDGPNVIWCRFNDDILEIEAALKKAGRSPVVYYGATSDEERKERKKLFMSGKASDFVANPATAGMGLDGLQTVCQRSIWYSNSYNREHRWQGEDRIHRLGMCGTALNVDMIAPGTVDKMILASYKKTEDLIRSLMSRPELITTLNSD